MRSRFFIFCILWLFAFDACSQEEIPCYAIFNDLDYMYSPLYKDSTGYWFIPKQDTTVLVFFSNDRNVYKHFSRFTNQLLVEGSFGGRIYIDSHSRFGKWKEYYENGNLKTTGYYYCNDPIGTWCFYYPNGVLKESYSISLFESEPASSYCKTGSYEFYYPNGNVKVSGFYRAAVDSTTEERYDLNGEIFIAQVRKPISKPHGMWTFYNEDGSIAWREEYVEDINPYFWYSR